VRVGQRRHAIYIASPARFAGRSQLQGEPLTLNESRSGPFSRSLATMVIYSLSS
jgi:hypothetical protein